jgi:hypothetical protein
LWVGLQVSRAGRYDIVARADDATGRGFAYLQSSTDLPAGAQRVKLRLFGKLILDERAQPPFRLRDLEGERLVDDTPEVMATWAGPVYTTRAHARSAFSPEEHHSEEKERRLARFADAVLEAQR